jgi:putative membrane protein
MKKVATITGIALVALMVLLLASGAMMGHYGNGMGHYGGMMNGYGGMMSGYGFNLPGAILSFTVWVLIIGALLAGPLWLARKADRGESNSELGESPVEILNRRYAKGEIGKEEFDAIKRDLAA